MIQETEALSPFGVVTRGATIADLPTQAREFLERHGTVRQYRKDEEVLRQQVVPEHIAWIQTGRLKSVVMQADGSEHHQGWIMQTEWVGVKDLLLQSPSRVTLVVVTDTATVLHLSHPLFMDMMLNVPDACVGVAVGLSRRIQQLHDILDLNGPRMLVDQLRVVLAWWIKNHGVPARDGSVELWVSQDELAHAVTASRQRVHLELKTLRDLGEVDLAYRKIIIRPQFFRRLGQPIVQAQTT